MIVAAHEVGGAVDGVDDEGVALDDGLGGLTVLLGEEVGVGEQAGQAFLEEFLHLHVIGGDEVGASLLAYGVVPHLVGNRAHDLACGADQSLHTGQREQAAGGGGALDLVAEAKGQHGLAGSDVGDAHFQQGAEGRLVVHRPGREVHASVTEVGEARLRDHGVVEVEDGLPHPLEGIAGILHGGLVVPAGPQAGPEAAALRHDQIILVVTSPRKGHAVGCAEAAGGLHDGGDQPVGLDVAIDPQVRDWSDQL